LRAHSFLVIPILGMLNLDHLSDGLGVINVTLIKMFARREHFERGQGPG